ncbi:MAG: hypothetical protein R2880_21920 [Deinococcales bacterium]
MFKILALKLAFLKKADLKRIYHLIWLAGVLLLLTFMLSSQASSPYVNVKYQGVLSVYGFSIPAIFDIHLDDQGQYQFLLKSQHIDYPFLITGDCQTQQLQNQQNPQAGGFSSACRGIDLGLLDMVHLEGFLNDQSYKGEFQIFAASNKHNIPDVIGHFEFHK